MATLDVRCFDEEADVAHCLPRTAGLLSSDGGAFPVTHLGLAAGIDFSNAHAQRKSEQCRTGRTPALPICANTDPQRDSIVTKGPANVLDHATSEMAIGAKLGIDATKKTAGECFKHPWPPLIRMSEKVRRKIDALFGGTSQ